MSGMMTARGLGKLGTLLGNDVDKTWLSMVTGHHT